MKRNEIYSLSFSILALVFTAVPSMGQELLTLNGRIVSGNREPVANVAVSVRGSSQLPKITDRQFIGYFSIIGFLHLSPPVNKLSPNDS